MTGDRGLSFEIVTRHGFSVHTSPLFRYAVYVESWFRRDGVRRAIGRAELIVKTNSLTTAQAARRRRRANLRPIMPPEFMWEVAIYDTQEEAMVP